VTFQDLIDDVEALGGLHSSDEEATARRWARGGLSIIAAHGAWPWLRDYCTLSLSAGVYAYNMAATASNPIQTSGGRDGTAIDRIDTRGMRYGSDNQKLEWAPFGARSIDTNLGPQWKDAATANGRPKFICRVGRQLWVARKPSQEFIDDYPSIYFYCTVSEDTSDDDNVLLLPDMFRPHAVEASLAYGAYQEEDDREQMKLAHWRQVWLPEMDTQLDLGEAHAAFRPTWAIEDYDQLSSRGYSEYTQGDY